MIEPRSLEILEQELKTRIEEDRKILDEMRAEIRPLKTLTRRIQPRSARAVSLVGPEGGNNQIRFDPFRKQLVRVVDSNQNEYCLEVITPRASMDALNARHFASDGTPLTALGRMTASLGKTHVKDLSFVFSPQLG